MNRTLLGTFVGFTGYWPRTMFFALTTVLALGSGTASAQSSAATGDTSRQTALEEVTVWAKYVPVVGNAATKMDVPVLETPQSISVITGAQIELLNWQTIEQATRYTSGIAGGTYGADNRFDWLYVRAFKPTTYVDGLQLPEATFAVSRLDLASLDALEILKGPSSTLYGAVPPGGLINMISKRPREEFEADLSVQVGSHDHYRATGEISGPLTDSGTLLARLGATYQDYGAVTPFSDNQRLMLQPSLTWQPNERLTVTLLGLYQDDDLTIDLQFLPEVGTALPNPNGQLSRSTYVSDPDYDSFLRDESHVGYLIDYQISDHIKFHQGVRLSDVRADGRQLFGGGFFDDIEQRILARFDFKFLEDADNLTTDTSLEFDFETGAVSHRLLAGVDYRDHDGRYTAGFDFGPSLDLYDPVFGNLDLADPALFTDSRRDDRQIGGYLQEHARIANWAITAGLRYDDYDSESLERLFGGSESEITQHATSGRIGINYLFESGIAPYVSYSESFEPQSGFDANTGQPFVPTTGEQQEIGVKYQPRSQSGLVSVALYELKQQNVPTSTPGVPGSREQVGEITVQGVEFEAVAKINDVVSINAAYAFTDAIVTESKRPTDLDTMLAFTPRHQAALFVDYTMNLASGATLDLGGGVRYVGEQFGNPGEVGLVPAHTQVDALVHYTKGPWRFTLNVNNLFDIEYLSSCDGFGSCYWGFSRTIIGTVARKWGNGQ